MHSKNNNGFTLIEVLLALMIMGLVFGSVYVSQGSAIRVIKSYSVRLRRVLAAKDFLIEMTTGQEDEKTQQEKQFKDDVPPTRLMFTQEPVKSSALKDFNDMVVQKVKAEWLDGSIKNTEELITFAFKPKKEKQES